MLRALTISVLASAFAVSLWGWGLGFHLSWVGWPISFLVGGLLAEVQLRAWNARVRTQGVVPSSKWRSTFPYTCLVIWTIGIELAGRQTANYFFPEPNGNKSLNLIEPIVSTVVIALGLGFAGLHRRENGAKIDHPVRQ